MGIKESSTGSISNIDSVASAGTVGAIDVATGSDTVGAANGTCSDQGAHPSTRFSDQSATGLGAGATGTGVTTTATDYVATSRAGYNSRAPVVSTRSGRSHTRIESIGVTGPAQRDPSSGDPGVGTSAARLSASRDSHT
ncbi:GPI-anchored hemophore cfmA-like [Cryptomeria japonica]|uniref:GPI-anchored hemophore cfmA-like n=1 Tax=Cryptomeria japonica TaxID=3369 RepID=UPI0027D9E670|nr:GPI-anchored hemophore cfmA-like [Cryptomeria japonica]